MNCSSCYVNPRLQPRHVFPAKSHGDVTHAKNGKGCTAVAALRLLNLTQADVVSHEARLSPLHSVARPPLTSPLLPNPCLTFASIGPENGSVTNAPDLATSPPSAETTSSTTSGANAQALSAEAPEPWSRGSDVAVPEEIRLAKERIFSILKKGPDGTSAEDFGGSWSLYADESASSALEEAVGVLIDEKISPRTRAAEKSMTLGQGTWEVFYAPHLSRLSRPVGVRFDPIRYTLRGALLSSNVRCSGPLAGRAWLSASGELVPTGDERVTVRFDSFWVDGGGGEGSELRPLLEGEESLVDSAITQLGRALFFPQFSVFPVLYVDADIAVFQFTPLQSNIAARRIN